ncbi:MAG: DNRLRE domain-containing protein [bacterium]|nr:DNRLRE domain-containing protein [bacterium]
MVSEILYCKSCFSYVENSECIISPKYIILGESYKEMQGAYFYFPVERISSNARIQNAELVFYEVKETKENVPQYFQYVMAPTRNYINPYTTYNSSGNLAMEYYFSYKVKNNANMIIINITPLVSLWVTREIINYGFVIELEHGYGRQTLAGVGSKAVEPFLKITYLLPEGELLYYHEPSVQLPVEISIKEQ